jgi:hypothetical protein
MRACMQDWLHAAIFAFAAAMHTLIMPWKDTSLNLCEPAQNPHKGPPMCFSVPINLVLCFLLSLAVSEKSLVGVASAHCSLAASLASLLLQEQPSFRLILLGGHLPCSCAVSFYCFCILL